MANYIQSSIVACQLLRQRNPLTDAQRNELYSALEETASWLECNYSTALNVCIKLNKLAQVQH